MNKKNLILLILLITLACAGGIFIWQKGNSTSLRQTFEAGPLTVGNADNANLTIVRAPVNRVSVELQGNPESLKKIHFFKEGGSSAIQFSDEWKKITGTLTVPEDTPVDVLFSKKTIIQNEPTKEDETLPIELPSAQALTSLQIPKGAGGSLTIGATGVNLKTDQPTILLPSDLDLYGSAGVNDMGTGSGLTTCALGSQSLRDRCCKQKNIQTATPGCAGNWVFDNTADACTYRCLNQKESGDYFGGSSKDDEGSQNPENPGAGSAAGGNTSLNPDTSGSNSGTGSTSGAGANPGTGSTSGTVGDEPADPTSRLCLSRPTSAERSLCCNDSLKNPLSLGPRPGFPDCMGTWSFNETDKLCQFKCASYEESLDIMNEIRRNAIDP